MCFFLTVAVPAQHIKCIDDAFGRGFQTHASANPHVAAALPAGYAARLITSGMCSCDLYTRPSASTPSDPAPHLKRKYEKLGWSQAKIERALRQAAASDSKIHRPAPGLCDDVTQRLISLCRAAASIALFVHWYDGDVDTERPPLHHAHPCSCQDLSARAKQLHEDELLVATTR